MPDQISRLSAVFNQDGVSWLSGFYYRNENADGSSLELSDLMNAFNTVMVTPMLPLMSIAVATRGVVGERVDPRRGVPLLIPEVRNGGEIGVSIPSINAACFSHYTDPSAGVKRRTKNYIAGIATRFIEDGRLTQAYKFLADGLIDAMQEPLTTTSGDWRLVHYGQDEIPYDIVKTVLRPQIANVRSRLQTSLFS